MFNTRTFANIFESASGFLKDYRDSDLTIQEMDDETIKRIFTLLYAEYGNSPIVNDDEQQFKYRVWSIIFSHGPKWKQDLLLQEEVRKMKIEDFMKGSEVVMNHANNPGTAPGTKGTDELDYVDDQTVSKRKRGYAEALQFKQDILSSDYTAIFVGRFKPLFSRIAIPNNGPRYLGDDEDEEN